MIKSLISLRGIFILFIFFTHCLNLYPGGGTMAVAFFFVLGGFSMTLGYKEKLLSPDFNYTQYITRRCIKFFPLHWLCIILVLPLEISSFNIMKFPVLFANATLIQSWIPIRDVFFSFNRVSWYLADTMYFALMFPIVFKLIVLSNNKIKITIVFVLAIIYAILVLLLPIEKYHPILYISPYMRLLDFIFGIFLALLYMRLKDKPCQWWNGKYVGQILIFGLIVLLIVESCCLSKQTSFISPVYWILVAIIILIASLLRNEGGVLENKFLQRLGELSFIIFMTHHIILRYAYVFFSKYIHFNYSINNIIFVFLTFVITIFTSIFVDYLIMKPTSRWLTKKLITRS